MDPVIRIPVIVAVSLSVFGLQGIAVLFDEFRFHRARELPRWERLGHPLDTASVLACFAWMILHPYHLDWLLFYAGLSILSCLFVTKDESVHQRHCSAAEHWCHSVLFILHPLVLISGAALWWAGQGKFLIFEAFSIAFFMLYQALYWNWIRRSPARISVNNEIYDQLREKWYSAQDDPVALLRAESRARNPYVENKIKEHHGAQACKILDIGCGGGFLSNFLSAQAHQVTGLDASSQSLDVARSHDPTARVAYVHGDAYRLPFPEASFDVVCAMDFLEHVDDPGRVILEARRVLRPGGQFFFYTFNKNLLAWLVVIQGMEWFVANTPERLHVYSLFIKPREMVKMCESAGLQVSEMRGLRPRFMSKAFIRLILSGRVSEDFSFRFTRSLAISYLGVATRDP